ncbi:MAG: CoA transferase [Dehalococcoidales bacterium]|nr:CoA transferase [Dehalococcoidales bacterium]
MAGPLSGIKVIEITNFQQGPVAGMRLGDLGADVIKIETKTGDPARDFMRIIGAESGLKGHNYYFEHNNRNKKSIVLDLKKARGKEIFFKLIDTADVFLTNMSIDAPIKMGIGPKVLLKRNPRLIYAHASGWGRHGTDANYLSFDYTGIARSGLMMTCGERGSPPAQIIPGVGDEIGGLMCAWGVTAALYTREKTGKGQLVDTSLMGSIIGALGLIMAAPAILGQEFQRGKRDEAGNPLYSHYQCQDGKWLAIAHLQPDKYWPNVCRAIDLPDLKDDPRFGSIESRCTHSKELVAILDAKFATKPRDEWLKILKESNCICTPVQSQSEVCNDPQALANKYFINVEHPEWGEIKMVGFPWDFSETPAAWGKKAPELGEHTDEVLLGLGYDQNEIAELKREGITN